MDRTRHLGRSRGAKGDLAALALAGALLLVVSSAARSQPGPGGWSQLGNGGTPTSSSLNGAVYALNAEASGPLYAGGAFTNAGGEANADYVARWSGGSWSALGAAPLTGAVHAIASRGNRVYVGGVFQNAGGDANLDFLAVWDGTAWGGVCNGRGPAIAGNVHALEIVGSTIYVGGSFQNGAGIASADYLLACDLNTGAPRSTVDTDGGISGSVYALTSDSGGNLYAGGGFSNLAGIPAADRVAFLNASGWHAMGSGPGQGGGAVDSFVRALAASGTNVYVGTDAVNVAGIPQADHVARWNGSAWSALGSNTAGGDGWFPASAAINALATSGARVFAGGSFQNANGEPTADHVAVFDGTGWGPLGSNGGGDGPLNAAVAALTTQATLLYAGGTFTSAGGNSLARFAASVPVAGVAGGGGPPPTTTTTPTTTTPPGAGAVPPPTGTATGTVLVNGRRFTGGPIPYGRVVDVTRGRLVLRADTGTLTVNGAGGIPAAFVLVRGTDNRRPIVELRLTRGNFSVCPARKKNSAGQAAPTKTVRQLWGSGKGRFRTRGRYASATVRGTNWLTADRCNGTFVRVRQGVLGVLDPPRRTQVLVRAPRTYLATP